MNPKEILEFILRKEKISYSNLAKKMGISRAQPLYDIRDGKIKLISANYANRIIKAFPGSGYTFDFLITGNESLADNGNIVISEERNVPEPDFDIEFLRQSLIFSQDTVSKQRKTIAELEDEILRLKAENATLKNGTIISGGESKDFAG